MPEISVFENINSSDFSTEGDHPLMKVPATTGYSVGVSFRKNSRKRLYFLWGLGISFNPQVMHFGSSSSSVTEFPEEQFTNTELWLKSMLGIKTVEIGSGYFDVAAGLKFLVGLNGKEAPGKVLYASYVDPATGNQYQYLAAYHELNWGDTRSSDSKLWAPCIFNFIGQIGYNFDITEGHLLRIAAEVGTKIGTDQSIYSNNTGLEIQYDVNRNRISKTKFNDYHTYVGVNLSLGL